MIASFPRKRMTLVTSEAADSLELDLELVFPPWQFSSARSGSWVILGQALAYRNCQDASSKMSTCFS